MAIATQTNSAPSVPAQAAPQNPKHMKSFWPLVVVIIAAFIAGVITMYLINDSEIQDDISSISFMRMMGRTKKVTSPSVSPVPTIDQTTTSK